MRQYKNFINLSFWGWHVSTQLMYICYTPYIIWWWCASVLVAIPAIPLISMFFLFITFPFPITNFSLETKMWRNEIVCVCTPCLSYPSMRESSHVYKDTVFFSSAVVMVTSFWLWDVEGCVLGREMVTAHTVLLKPWW